MTGAEPWMVVATTACQSPIARFVAVKVNQLRALLLLIDYFFVSQKKTQTRKVAANVMCRSWSRAKFG